MLLADDEADSLRARELHHCPTGEGEEGRAREHLPSCRELASRNPLAEMHAHGIIESAFPAHRFAFHRPAPRVRGVTSFLPASALRVPASLSTSWRSRRAMLPTDFCHPCDMRAPVPRAFPARSAARATWRPHGVFGSVQHDWGTECFTTLENASADRDEVALCLLAPRHDPRLLGGGCRGRGRGRVVPTAPVSTEPLAPLSLPLVSVRPGRAFARPSYGARVLMGIARRVSHVEEAAKTAVTDRLVKAGGA